MFTRKIPNEFINLFVELAATDKIDSKGVLTYQADNWLHKHYSFKEYEEISGRVANRRSQLAIEEEKKKEIEENKLQKLKSARVIVVPHEIAEEAIKLWNYYHENNRDMLTEYRFEHLILENCPTFKEFIGSSYDFVVINGELTITEVFE